MKRIGYLHEKVCNWDNIELADKNARKHKTKSYGVQLHDRNAFKENLDLLYDLQECKYKTSEYTTFKIYEPKERIIYRLPYYPDRIAHHALMNILEPIWNKIFIKHTYSCIKERGIHKLAKDLKKVLRRFPDETTYCLKLDIRKFYPSINHDILYNDIIKRKIKDPYLLEILKEIIYSADGVPIGNYLSQYFANLYLAYFDHWVKEQLKCKFYFRYADDIVILSDNKEFLHDTLKKIKVYLKDKLALDIKPNYQVFPVEARGIDFVGYVFRHNYTLLRKSIKLKILKLIKDRFKGKITGVKAGRSLKSYYGWIKHCDGHNFLDKLYTLTGVKLSKWSGETVSLSKIYNKYVWLLGIDTNHKKYYIIHVVTLNHRHVYNCKTRNRRLYQAIKKLKKIPTKILIRHHGSNNYFRK